MAHRKDIESLLENDCSHWANNTKLELVDSDCSSYVWNITHQNTVYEIVYSDRGEIALNAIPSKCWHRTEIREIYVGDNSEISYRKMIELLTDNFSNQYL